MKKATKEKTQNNEKKRGIFDYESEVNNTTPIQSNIDNSLENEEVFLGIENQTQVNKKAIKKIQKRKKAQAINEKNSIKREKQRERKIQKQRINSNIKKPPKRARTLTKIICTIIVGAILLMIFALSPIFYITEIQVIGNEKVKKQEVISLLHIEENTNIFKEQNSEIKSRLKENAYIDTDKTEIIRNLPSTLCINVKERTAEYLLEFGGGFVYADKDGNILEISSKVINEKVIIQGLQTSQDDIKPGNKLSEQDMKNLSKLENILNSVKKHNMLDKVTSANISDDADIVLYLESEKKKIHMGEDTGLDTKMLYVKAILEKEKDNEGEIFVNMNLNKKNAYFKQNI